jgi:hypothetical protein
MQALLLSLVRIVASHTAVKPFVGGPFKYRSDASPFGPGRFFEGGFTGGGNAPAVDVILLHALQCSAQQFCSQLHRVSHFFVRGGWFWVLGGSRHYRRSGQYLDNSLPNTR